MQGHAAMWGASGQRHPLAVTEGEKIIKRKNNLNCWQAMAGMRPISGPRALWFRIPSAEGTDVFVGLPPIRIKTKRL
jgi:hypothetical protein